MENFIRIFNEIYLYLDYAIKIAFAVFLVLSFHYVFYLVVSFIKTKKPSGAKNKHRFAVLIPARDESVVINNSLESLYNQDYPKELYDVYVIVEDMSDKTVEIAKKYNYKIILRDSLEGRRTKGYALDDAYKYLKKNNLNYDAYLVFDADNIINPDYISIMNEVKNKGYKVGVGYRNYSNGTKNWLTRGGSILFSFINNFKSNGESVFFKKATLCGTGYYIDSDIVEDAGGWIWNGMTEDMELTEYCHAHNISMHYSNSAMFFDEQAPKLKMVLAQHTRWVWGYLLKNKNLKKMNDTDYQALKGYRRFVSDYVQAVSLFPFIAFVIVEAIAFLMSLSLVISGAFIQIYHFEFNSYIFSTCMSKTIVYFLFLYSTFVFLALFTFIADNGRLKFGFFNVFRTSLAYPIYIFIMVIGFFDGLFHKEKRTTWQKIEHGDSKE